ncbi:hypothetical protein [Avibacterium paragallinarum]|uniref:hypothetical protein n=1 Tax=Avibacterium paragallinarum TaxID=728 RepID=UPI002EDB9E67
MCNQCQFKGELSAWLGRSLSEQDLVVAESIFKAIDKYGLEGARVQIGFERAKRNLLLAHQRMSELCTNKEE